VKRERERVYGSGGWGVTVQELNLCIGFLCACVERR
jgi:hypothetical protein